MLSYVRGSRIEGGLSGRPQVRDHILLPTLGYAGSTVKASAPAQEEPLNCSGGFVLGFRLWHGGPGPLEIQT